MTITTQPTGWADIGQLYALLPFMVIMMVLVMVMKTVTRVTEPEFVREARPIAEKVAVAKMLPIGKK